MAVDNFMLGEFQLKDLPKKPKGALKVEVTLDVDYNSKLHVTAICASNEEEKVSMADVTI